MNFITDNIVVILTSIGLGGGSGGLIGFFTGKKLKKSKEKHTESSALVEMQSAYNTFTRDFNVKIELQDKELLEIRKENREQRADIRILQKDNTALHKEIRVLSKENNQLRAMVSDLTLKNETLSFELKKYKRK